jgi:hypothetical protein
LGDTDGELCPLQRILKSHREWDFCGGDIKGWAKICLYSSGNRRITQINQGPSRSITQIDWGAEAEGLKGKELSFSSYRLKYHGDHTQYKYIKEYLEFHETEIRRPCQGENGTIIRTSKGFWDYSHERGQNYW